MCLLLFYNFSCVLDSIYDEICSEEDSEERNSIFRNIEKQSSINRYVARIAFLHGDYIAALKNEEFLLSIDFDDNDTNLDFIIMTMLEADIISLLGEIAKTGKLLSYKSKCLDNKMIIEFLMDNYYEDNDYFNIPIDTWLYMTEDGITLLEVMIRYNRNLIKHLVDSNPEYFSNIRIFTILHANGITGAALDINIAADDLEKFLNPEQDDRAMSLNTFSLIGTFRNLMLQDGRSDIKAINMACSALEDEFKNNPDYASRDLESLINIKKDNPDFSLRIIVPGKTPPDIKVATFSPRDNTVYLRETSDGSIFTHEIGHVIHYYSCGYAVPETFLEYMARNNLPTDKIRRFAIDLYKKNQDIKQQLYEEYYSKDNQQLSQKYYDDYLKRVQADLMSATNEPDYPKEYIEYLSGRILSFEEFSLYFDTVLKWEYIFLKRDMALNYELYLEDIFDALSGGQFLSEGTDDDINYFITGHGCSYYLDDYDCSLAFTEILAQYITIVKSPKAKELLGILSDIMGAEFVDMLGEFYNNMYVEDKKQLKGAA